MLSRLVYIPSCLGSGTDGVAREWTRLYARAT